jgi:ABC-2 type transport system permease protein
LNLASVIVKGDLDVWLSHPRAVLPHLLVGRSVPSAWGDAAFGYVVYLAFVRPDPMRIAMFTVLTFAVALVFVGVGIVAGSISFFIGNASAFADEWKFAVVTFATYPPTLFEGAVKVLLFTLIPAGFVSYVPVEGLRSLSWMYVGISFGAAIAILALSAGVFYLGLRRYESGNLILMNG